MPAEWRDISSDPDPIRDLGYEMVDMEVVRTHDGDGEYMFIPSQEDMIAEDAFMVAEPSAVCDPVERV